MDDKDFLKHLENIKQPDQQALFQDSDKILKILIADVHAQTQKNFTATLGANLNQSTEYTIKKLIMGILSQNPVIQLNYTSVLTKILQKFHHEINFQKLYKFIIEKSSKNQAVNKSEKKYFLIGRFYMLRALIIAYQNITLEELHKIYDNLCEEMESQPWVQELGLNVIELSLNNNENIKEKVKYLINAAKFLYTEQNFTNISFLIILDSICEKNQVKFALNSQINDRISNFKNLHKSLENELNKFPNVSVGVKYMVEYLKNQNKDFLKELFIYLLTNMCTGLKGYYLTLFFLKKFLKNVQIEDLQHVMIEELWQLWSKNLSVLNPNLKTISQKIMKQLTNIFQKQQENINENQQKITQEFLFLLKSKSSTFRFTTKSQLAQSILNSLNEEQLAHYHKFLKKHLNHSHDVSSRSFYLNEIFVMAEISYKRLSTPIFFKTSMLMLEESSSFKLKKFFEKIPEEAKQENEIGEEQYIEKNQEVIQGYFFSFLQVMSQQVPQQYQEKKNILYKGFDLNNESLLFKFLCYLYENQTHFHDEKILNQLKYLVSTIEFLKPIFSEIKILLDQHHSLDFKDQDFQIKKKLSFVNLVTAVSLQSLFFPEEMNEILSEMKVIFQRMELEKNTLSDKIIKKRKISHESVQSIDQSDIPSINVLTDLLIMLLTKSVQFLRQSINNCFTQYIDEMKIFSVETIVASLTRPNAEYLKEMKAEQEQEDSIYNLDSD